ncbi:MAG: methionyl-tRNA formyltransferase [Caldimonas sp.]
MRIAFAGTPEFARVALAHLLDAGFEIPLVLTQPDRPAGRGLKLQPSPVKACAVEHGIAVIQPHGLRPDGRYVADAEGARAALLAARPDAIVVAAYGLILPGWVLDLPRYGCINIHASLLPRWRGAAPIHRAIEAGDAAAGITIMQMDAGLDTGAMLLAEPAAIGADDTTATLQARLAERGGALVITALRALQRGELAPHPQPEDGATYAHKVGKDEAEIDWRLPAAAIERRLRAFDPFPGASSELDGAIVKCWRGRVADGAAAAGDPGLVLDVGADGIRVACGAGALVLTELQRPGGRRVPAREFLQRIAVTPGMRFAAKAFELPQRGPI